MAVTSRSGGSLPQVEIPRNKAARALGRHALVGLGGQHARDDGHRRWPVVAPEPWPADAVEVPWHQTAGHGAAASGGARSRRG